jgi:hypothetical protein
MSASSARIVVASMKARPLYADRVGRAANLVAREIR